MRSRVLHRYVLRELTGPFVSAAVVLLSLFYAFVLVRGVDLLLGSGAELMDWARVGLSMLPMLLPQVLPVALLLGVMIGFSRLGEDRELAALSSAGVSPASLVRPTLWLSAGVSLVLIATVFFWRPWGLAELRHTARAVIERNVLSDLRPGTVRADLPGVVFHAAEVSAGPTWRDALLIDEREEGRVSVLSAPLAKAVFSEGVGITFERGVLVQRDDGALTTTSFDAGTLRFNLNGLSRRDTLRFGLDELGPVELRARAQELERTHDAQARTYWSAFHFRLSQLVAPFVLGLLATALALSGRGRSARTAALLALGTYLLFFVITRAGMQVGARGVIAPWLAGYAPTALALLAGLALLWRAQKRGVA